MTSEARNSSCMNARRKAEAQQTAHGKDMIGEAPGVGVVLVNDKAALVIKQSVEDIGRLVSGRGDHLGVKWTKLIGSMSVELDARVLTVMQVHQSSDFPASAGVKELSVRG